MPFLEAQLIPADVGDHRLGVDLPLLGQLALDDPFHSLRRDLQAAGDATSSAVLPISERSTNGPKR
jgi:hypothetical protein